MKSYIKGFMSLALALFLLTGCGKAAATKGTTPVQKQTSSQKASKTGRTKKHGLLPERNRICLGGRNPCLSIGIPEGKHQDHCGGNL